MITPLRTFPFPHQYWYFSYTLHYTTSADKQAIYVEAQQLVSLLYVRFVPVTSLLSSYSHTCLTDNIY